jgi:hypothetical protein
LPYKITKKLEIFKNFNKNYLPFEVKKILEHSENLFVFKRKGIELFLVKKYLRPLLWN